MQHLHNLYDGRINAENHLVEMTLNEYLTLAREVINNNEFQRRRVNSSSTIYSLLKEDFKRGCIIPPIVLSLGIQSNPKSKPQPLDYETLKKNVSQLTILDGLQRTYTLIDLTEDVKSDEEKLKAVLEKRVRIEIYVGLNRLGILYRMLTLNTGQTPMSLRQQIEMLYLDYSRHSINQIKLIKEVDDESPKALGEYSFRSMIEGFNSYIERNELPIDRFDLLESIKTLERLSREDVESNLFPDFISTYHQFVESVYKASPSTEYTTDAIGIQGQPFGKDIRRIFTKSQAITGFGAAIGRLRDSGSINSFVEVKDAIKNIDTSTIEDDIKNLLLRLEQIRLSSKKIGNSQRLYFHFMFRQLFNPSGEAYLRIGQAIDTAFNRYETEMM